MPCKLLTESLDVYLCDCLFLWKCEEGNCEEITFASVEAVKNKFKFKLSFIVIPLHVWTSVVKNIDISISIDTEISERYQY